MPADRQWTDDGPALPLSSSVWVALTPRIVGRYALFDRITSGGSSVVHLGRDIANAEPARVVAIKRVHGAMARDLDFVSKFREEMSVLSNVRHPKVVSALDVLEDGDELLLILEYIHGQSLAALVRQARESRASVPIEVCVALAIDVLDGLHAAHTATSSSGAPLGIVHQDVSPRNILLGSDGVARISDFGVAKAGTSRNVTRTGHIKGKLNYLAPEHLLGRRPGLRGDIYGVAVVLWELLASAPLFQRASDVETLRAVVSGEVPGPGALARRMPAELERVVRRGLAHDPAARFASALEMAVALRGVIAPAPAADMEDWMLELAHAPLVHRSRQLARAENFPLFPGNPRPKEQG